VHWRFVSHLTLNHKAESGFTKTALATAALRLVAQERLGLDEPFDGRPYTLRQLLQHRAGVPDYGSLPCYHDAIQRSEKPWDVTKLLDQVEADRLEFEPDKIGDTQMSATCLSAKKSKR
jgi:CubicO group peptidase (beta-lactamase class C family)